MADFEHGGRLLVHVHFVMDEFANGTQLYALWGLRSLRPEAARRKELRLGAIRQSKAPAFAEMSQGTNFQHADPGWLFENGRPGGVGDDGTIVRSKTVIFRIVFDLQVQNY